MKATVLCAWDLEERSRELTCCMPGLHKMLAILSYNCLLRWNYFFVSWRTQMSVVQFFVAADFRRIACQNSCTTCTSTWLLSFATWVRSLRYRWLSMITRRDAFSGACSYQHHSAFRDVCSPCNQSKNTTLSKPASACDINWLFMKSWYWNCISPEFACSLGHWVY